MLYLINMIWMAFEALRWLLILLFFIVVFGIFAPYISNLDSFHYAELLVHFDAHLNTLIHNIVPTRILNHDVSHLITLAIIIFLMNFLQSFADRIKFFAQKKAMLRELNSFRQNSNLSNQDKISSFASKIEQVSSSNKSRQELLKEFTKIKLELEKIGRDLTFLSIDIVDSTAMKKGEDAHLVENDFIEYRNFVEQKFKESGMIKATWTPDGVMACFNTLNEAVKAAESIITGLDYFNKNVKTINPVFRVRCGINSGRVYYDDTLPLEQLSDRTIDIAGHMQKHAQPNTILLAKKLIEPINNTDGFIDTDHLVDGIEVSAWIKKK